MDVVLLDVNDTLLVSNAQEDFTLPRWTRFRRFVVRQREFGRAVGLCSDSPLSQLQEFGRFAAAPAGSRANADELSG
jgi:hypothetical protein